MTDRIFGLRPATARLLGLIAIAGMAAAMALNLAASLVPAGPNASMAARHSDFDMFHVVARLALEGRIAEAYDLHAMRAAQVEFGGVPRAMTWTYPPPFDLLLAPLGLLGRNVAYLLFGGATLALYLWAVARLAGRHWGIALIGALPAVVMSLRSGQNGCLTAALAALACVAVLSGRPGRAGIPLGLLVVKPHLGLGLGLWAIATLRWRMGLVAGATAALTCAAATAAFGPGVWAAFLGAVGEAGAQLEAGAYRAHRMASLHATLASLGLPHAAATAVQAGAAAAAALAVALAARRLPARPGLAVALVATPLFSPYLYDYDLALYGPALALLLPELEAAGRRALAAPAIALAWIAGGTGMVQDSRGASEGLVAPVTAAGLATVGLALLTLVAVRRAGRTVASGGTPETSHA